MKIRDVLDYVIELQEPAFSETVLLRWLNQVEAEIQTEVLLLAVDGIVQYTAKDMDAELIAPAPFSKLYEDYLNWRIALAQGEAERANNAEVIYHGSYLAYVRFVCDTIAPGNGVADQIRYYLTAYQIAVKLGFRGTEIEWIASLKGKKGDTGEGLNIVGEVATETELPDTSEMEPGTAYLVGKDADALLFIWNGKEWFYKRSLRGKQGIQGERGPDSVYVGSGDMPDGYNVQIDPNGLPMEDRGKLVYIDADGVWSPLTIGPGLRIKNGVLMVVNTDGNTNSLLGAAVLGDMILGA